MRTLLVLGFLGCLYLHFHKQEVVETHMDVLSTKQSSQRKASSEKFDAVSLVDVERDTEKLVQKESEGITSADLNQEYDEDDLSQLPWDEIEEGWKTQLKDYLVSVDPEKAEEMFSAYLEEKKKYVERVDFSDSESGATQGTPASSEEPLVEQDGKEGELERLHSENLKAIFGDHYSQVEALHKEYVESVQYLNRASVKFSISL